MKKLLAVLLLIPCVVFAQCDKVSGTQWIAKTKDSIHKFDFKDNRSVGFGTISKAEAYRSPDFVNANEFWGDSVYYQYDCNVVIELPHLDAKTTQVYVYITGDKGYGYYIDKAGYKVMELSK